MRRFQTRFTILIAIMLVALAIGLCKLIVIDTKDQDMLQQRSRQQSQHQYPQFAQRGAIVDRNKTPLALSIPVNRIIIDPKTILKDKLPLDAMAKDPLIPYNKAELLSLINANRARRYLILIPQLSIDQSESLIAKRYPTLYGEKYNISYYPQSSRFWTWTCFV